MVQHKKIIWEKWVDPLGTNKDEEFVDEKQYYDNFSKYNDEDEEKYKPTKAAAVTSFGLIPVNFHNDPMKNFNFWVGHSNFKIGKNTALKILRSSGVEILDIFSPYRFRISVGKAFNFQDVRANIESALLKPIVNETGQESVKISIDDKLRADIKKKVEELKGQKFWLIYVAPNSEIEVSTPPDFQTFRKNKQILEKARDLAGGILLQSEVFGV